MIPMCSSGGIIPSSVLPPMDFALANYRLLVICIYLGFDISLLSTSKSILTSWRLRFSTHHEEREHLFMTNSANLDRQAPSRQVKTTQVFLDFVPLPEMDQINNF